jgi:hypothetical protein
VQYEDLVAAPPTEVRRLLRFLLPARLLGVADSPAAAAGCLRFFESGKDFGTAR